MIAKVSNRTVSSESRRQVRTTLDAGEQKRRGMAQIDPDGVMRVDDSGDIHIYLDLAKQRLNLTDDEADCMTDRLVLQNVRGRTILHSGGKEERR